jgi:phytoene/squalene synthetase
LHVADRIAFIDRQQALVDSCYQGIWPKDVTPQEALLVDLIRKDAGETLGLQIYIQKMLSVMVFDAERKNRFISQSELDEYVHNLATAVTEAMHYFIGHCCPTLQSDARYLAAAGAHITHMLRDTIEDNQAGYFNIPSEYLDVHNITPHQLSSSAYHAWVQRRVQLAHQYFAAGRGYLAQVENFRCRLAGYAYIARFEGILQAIEREGYSLRTDYQEFKSSGSALKVFWSALINAFKREDSIVGLSHSISATNTKLVHEK